MPVTEAVARSLAEKLQEFAATLPADERDALVTMLESYRSSVQAALAGTAVLEGDEEGLLAARQALATSEPMNGGAITVITTITVLQTSRWLCKPKDPKEPKEPKA